MALKKRTPRIPMDPGGSLYNAATAAILIHMYHSQSEPPFFGTQTGEEALARLEKLGAIESTYTEAEDDADDIPFIYSITPKGRAWVSSILHSPPPTPVYVDASGKIIPE